MCSFLPKISLQDTWRLSRYWANAMTRWPVECAVLGVWRCRWVGRDNAHNEQRRGEEEEVAHKQAQRGNRSERLRKDRVKGRNGPVRIQSRQSSGKATQESMQTGACGQLLCSEASCANTRILGRHKISHWPTGIHDGALPPAPYFSNWVKITLCNQVHAAQKTLCSTLLDVCYSVVWVEYALN